MHLTIAWRNIWRNGRRTSVILAAIVIGVWSMILLGSISRGFVVNMVENSISTLTGHLQIHARGYRTDPSIEKSMTEVEPVREALQRALPPEAQWSPRIRVNAVLQNARHSGGAVLVGIDPRREDAVSFIGPGAVQEGEYLEAGDDYGLLMGAALLESFETAVGRKVVVMSQDTDGEIASRAFRIRGVFRAATEATEKQFVFVTLPAAREMLGLKRGLSEIAVLLSRNGHAGPAAESLRARLAEERFSVATWRDLLPVIDAYLDIFDGYMVLWYLIVFVAMGFGIVNTILMTVFERMREFGLLQALGQSPGAIARGVLTEAFFLLAIGLLAGNALGFLSVFAFSGGIDLSAFAEGMQYFGVPRVIYPSVQARDVVTANVVVLTLGLLVSVYPAVKAARFSPVEAMAQT